MAASSAAASLLPPVKSVVVYRNGDPFYSGRKFVVNQRQVVTMEAFLNEVTQSIGAPLAVRTLYTPRQGHRVTDLQDLRTGAQYVAAGFERFKKLEIKMFLVMFSVFRNGDLLCPPFRFIIPRSMQQDLDQILSLITEKVSLRTGAVRRLCSLEGVAVSSAGELETGRCYVAVGTERFKKLPYVELLISKTTERKAGSGPEDQCSDSALLDSPESDGRRVKSTGDEAAAPQASQQRSRREGADETSAFFARPVKIRKNRMQTRPPLSQPSVFKSSAQKRREEVRGAEEVQEDENTATELPVDQVSFRWAHLSALNIIEVRLNLNFNHISFPKRAAEIVEEEELTNPDDPLQNKQMVGIFFVLLDMRNNTHHSLLYKQNQKYH
uniref:Doublecortin domain containing 2B n=1 Tax=Neolamprologus brichardi TaxID=32507 RepID=A0A3Q4IBH8_NEOBR